MSKIGLKRIKRSPPYAYWGIASFYNPFDICCKCGDAAKQLDRKINEDYPEIEVMHRIASAMAPIREKFDAAPYSEYEAILKEWEVC